jgi:hypothetical protein
LGSQMEGSDAGLGAAGNHFGRTGAEPNRRLSARTRGQQGCQEDSASRHLGFIGILVLDVRGPKNLAELTAGNHHPSSA